VTSRSPRRFFGLDQLLNRNARVLADLHSQRQRGRCLVQPDLRDHRSIAADLFSQRRILDVLFGHVFSECHHEHIVHHIHSECQALCSWDCMDDFNGCDKM
jgi:hypothetical protein